MTNPHLAFKCNAEELALIAQEIGAEVIRGTVRYPEGEGRFEVGETDIEELLHQLKDQNVVVIMAPLAPTEELPLICGLCGTPYVDDECPTCRTEREDAKRVIEEIMHGDRLEKGRE